MPLHAPQGGQPIGQVAHFYRRVLRILQENRVPFLIGGGYALELYTGLRRQTKDLDIYLRAQDVEPSLVLLERHGFATGLLDRYWLAKIYQGDEFVDVVFNHNNRSCPVDDLWLANGHPVRILDLDCLLCPAEELIWHKAFIMGRERYDGPDVAHLLETCAERLDWQRLLGRFDGHWRVFYSHLILFGYIYPSSRHRLPDWLMDDLAQRMESQRRSEEAIEDDLCAGTLLSAADYRADVQLRGYRDPRPYTDSSS